MDDKGINRLLREGFDFDPEMSNLQGSSPEDEEENDTSGNTTEIDDTSDEESELPRTKRPKRGEGWRGDGPTLKPHRKGITKSFIDGAGLPSPGRWPPKKRRLPNNDIAKEVREIFQAGIQGLHGPSPRQLPQVCHGVPKQPASATMAP